MMEINNPLFASDNAASVHPAILKAIMDANQGHAVGYGEDPLTQKATELTKAIFGGHCEVYFTLTGTGSNVAALQTALKPYEAVICAKSSHINEHECGATEHFSGSKLITIPTSDGKLSPDSIQPWLTQVGDVHSVQPKVISITQATELGTVYTVKEIAALAEFAHQHHLYLHMDGARLCNAAVYLDTSLAALTAYVGVDILSFGGTKNGMLCGEAVIIFNPTLYEDFPYFRKQSCQLFSKMRYVSTQFLAFWHEDLWEKNASHANQMAQLLTQGLEAFPKIKLLYPRQTNILFVTMPKSLLLALQASTFFYILDPEQKTARWVTSFDTSQEDVTQLLTYLQTS